MNINEMTDVLTRLKENPSLVNKHKALKLLEQGAVLDAINELLAEVSALREEIETAEKKSQSDSAKYARILEIVMGDCQPMA